MGHGSSRVLLRGRISAAAGMEGDRDGTGVGEGILQIQEVADVQGRIHKGQNPGGRRPVRGMPRQAGIHRAPQEAAHLGDRRGLKNGERLARRGVVPDKRRGIFREYRLHQSVREQCEHLGRP